MRRKAPSRMVVESARNQFLSTYKMLCTLVDVCPQSVWESYYFGFTYPVWYQVFHMVYFIDFWFQDTYGRKPILTMEFDSRIPPEFEYVIDPALIITKTDMQIYLTLLSPKITRYFDQLDDEKLGMVIAADAVNNTYADVVFSQNRHVMYNIGYLNAVLRNLNLKESDWYAYNEDDE